jgi:hypothetical protein
MLSWCNVIWGIRIQFSFGKKGQFDGLNAIFHAKLTGFLNPASRIDATIVVRNGA